jgi:hypothetical protein
VRYYSIRISDPSSGVVWSPPGFGNLLGDASYTSFVNGTTLPNAWDVTMDVPVIDSATPMGWPTVTVFGISVQEINQANNLVGKNISISGGMKAGLPLAKPQQSGLLFQGTIFQSFGNWIGTEMTLDLVVMPGTSNATQIGSTGTVGAPRNIVLEWQGGQTMAAALETCLARAFPNYKRVINLDSRLVRPSNISPAIDSHAVPTIQGLAQYCRQVSFDIIQDPDYAGVSIVPASSNSTIYVFDRSTPPSGAATKIAFEDMIGQPTWLEAGLISIKTVMRADLQVQQQITLPQARIINTQLSNSSLINQNATFQGGFSVMSVRHVGQFRQASADAWVTVIEAAPNKLVGSENFAITSGSKYAVS